jgi:hypothetical protein
VDLRWIFCRSSVDFRRFSSIFGGFSWIFGGSSVDLLSIFCRFSSIFVDFRRFSSIFVDFRRSSVDGNYVIGLARFSEAGLRSNEVLFFGFFPFAIIFWWASVDLLSIFCRFGVGGVDSGPIWSGFLRAAEGMALPRGGMVQIRLLPGCTISPSSRVIWKASKLLLSGTLFCPKSLDPNLKNRVFKITGQKWAVECSSFR